MSNTASVDKAIETLEALLNSSNEGFRLEAARELLKYDAAIR